MEDTVRVRRIIEYIGPRSAVEKQLASGLGNGTFIKGNGVTIRSVLLGDTMEIIQTAYDKWAETAQKASEV